MIRTIMVVFLALTTFPAQTTFAEDLLREALETRSQSILTKLQKDKKSSGATFKEFALSMSDVLLAKGAHERGNAIRWAFQKKNNVELPVRDIAMIASVFAREYYQTEIIKKSAELMKFKTYAVSGIPNRQNPEFIRQANRLEQIAAELGLHFRDVDGYVQEITIGESEKIFGVTVHSDVQPVDESAWRESPWDGVIKDGELWGRGAIDDKGPLVAIMYGMRALLDSGLPLRQKIVLLVGTDEESANEDINYYLSKNKAPDKTIVVDADYPVICAEKGWCGSWLKLPVQHKNVDSGMVITDLQAGFSPSIVPAKAAAKIVDCCKSADEIVNEIQPLIEKFHQTRQAAALELIAQDDHVLLTARGRAVHASVPETGHNALMDLLVFITDYLKPAPNGLALMAEFAARYIGFELAGKSLGIARHDEFMGNVSVAANMFQTAADSVMFMFNYRIPKGITSKQAAVEIEKRLNAFENEKGVQFGHQKYLSEAMYNDPETPFVKRLLGIYNDVTGESRSAGSMGGETYAKRIPNAVVFGPNMPDDEYRGHQPNERIKLSVLVKNIEILTHTLMSFALDGK